MRTVKKMFIAAFGGTILSLGVLMLVLPGPGIPVIIGGLALLAVEFEWARRMMEKIRTWIARRRVLHTASGGIQPAQKSLRGELPRVRGAFSARRSRSSRCGACARFSHSRSAPFPPSS